MKNLFSLVFAGIIGGLITLGGVYLLKTPSPSQKTTTTNIEQFVQPVAKKLNIKAGSVSAPFDFSMAAEKSMPSVVHITATQGSSNQSSSDPFEYFFGRPDGGLRGGTGSGVIYSSDGYIVTNNHVIEGATNIEVTLTDNRTFKAQVIGTDSQTDLAVLKIEARRLPVLKKADSDKARIGAWVLAVGNPFDLNSTVTAGIISAKGRDINIIQGNTAIESFIQTDAAVNPGNSGGALVDVNGNLLGINTAIATRTGYYQGYSFAIPVNIVTNIVDDIIENGTYERGFLGINIAEELTDEDIKTLNLDISQIMFIYIFNS